MFNVSKESNVTSYKFINRFIKWLVIKVCLCLDVKPQEKD